jgi:hypothetical protein
LSSSLRNKGTLRETGKNGLLESIYRIFGERNAKILDSAKTLHETHSTSGVAKIENSEMLKTRITEHKMSVNPKVIKPYSMVYYVITI